MSKSFNYKLKVFYEDTDAGGVVYYANYLKFLERARSEAIYSLGYSNTDLKKKFNILIIVKSCSIEYKKFAVLEDNLDIKTSLKSISKTSFVMTQMINRKNELIASAEICLVCVNSKGKPTKLPVEIDNLLKEYIN
mgnify:FL=1